MTVSTLPGQGSHIRLPMFTGYGYGGRSAPSGSLHTGELPCQTPCPPAQTTSQFPLSEPPPHQYQRRMPPKEQRHANDHSIQPHHWHDSQYGHKLVNGLDRPDPGSASLTHGISLSEHGARSLGALTDTVGVAQYLPPAEHAQYLTIQPAAGYHQQVPLPDPFSASESHQTAVMTGYNPTPTASSAGDLEHTGQQPLTRKQPDLCQNRVSNPEEAFGGYQHALCRAFDLTRAGRLIDASRTLLEVSEWLIGNARELGKTSVVGHDLSEQCT